MSSINLSKNAFNCAVPASLTNEIPHVPTYSILNSNLRSTWAYELIGKSYAMYTGTKNSRKIMNGVQSENYVARPITFVDPDTDAIYNAEIEKIDFNVEGAWETEMDYLMHEMARYLSKLYPDESNSLITLTEAERQSYFNEALHMIHSYFDTEQIKTGNELTEFYHRLKFLTGITAIRENTGITKQEKDLINLLNTGDLVTYTGYRLYLDAKQNTVISNEPEKDFEIDKVNYFADFYTTESQVHRKKIVNFSGKISQDNLLDFIENSESTIALDQSVLDTYIPYYVHRELNYDDESLLNFLTKLVAGSANSVFSLNELFIKATEQGLIKSGANLDALKDSKMGTTELAFQTDEKVYAYFSTSSEDIDVNLELINDGLKGLNPVDYENIALVRSAQLKDLDNAAVIFTGECKYSELFKLVLGNYIFSTFGTLKKSFETFDRNQVGVLGSINDLLQLQVDVYQNDIKIYSGLLNKSFFNDYDFESFKETYDCFDFNKDLSLDNVCAYSQYFHQIDTNCLQAGSKFKFIFKNARLQSNSAFNTYLVKDADNLFTFLDDFEGNYTITAKIGNKIYSGSTATNKLINTADKTDIITVAKNQNIIKFLGRTFRLLNYKVVDETGEILGYKNTFKTSSGQYFLSENLSSFLDTTVSQTRENDVIVSSSFEQVIEIQLENSQFEVGITSTNIVELAVQGYLFLQDFIEANTKQVLETNVTSTGAYIAATKLLLNNKIDNLAKNYVISVRSIANLLREAEDLQNYLLKELPCIFESNDVIKVTEDLSEDLASRGKLDCLVLDYYNNFTAVQVISTKVQNEYCYLTLNGSINADDKKIKKGIILIDLHQKLENQKNLTDFSNKILRKRNIAAKKVYRYNKQYFLFNYKWETLREEHLNFLFNNLFSKGVEKLYNDDAYLSSVTHVPTQLFEGEELTILDIASYDSNLIENLNALINENKSLYLDSSFKSLVHVPLNLHNLVYNDQYELYSYLQSDVPPSYITLLNVPGYENYEPLKDLLDAKKKQELTLEEIEKIVSRRFVIWGNVIWDANNTNKTVSALRTIWGGYFTNFEIYSTSDVLPSYEDSIALNGSNSNLVKKDLEVLNYNYANNNHAPANNWQIATTINRSSLGTSQIEAVDAYTHATLKAGNRFNIISAAADKRVFLDSMSLTVNMLDKKTCKLQLSSLESTVESVDISNLNVDFEVDNEMSVIYDNINRLYKVSIDKQTAQYGNKGTVAKLRSTGNMVYLENENNVAKGAYESILSTKDNELQMFLEYFTLQFISDKVFDFYQRNPLDTKAVDFYDILAKTGITFATKTQQRQYLSSVAIGDLYPDTVSLKGWEIYKGVDEDTVVQDIKLVDVLDYVSKITTYVPTITVLNKDSSVNLYMFRVEKTSEGYYVIHESTAKEYACGDLIQSLLPESFKAFQVPRSLYTQYSAALFKYQDVLPNTLTGVFEDLDIIIDATSETRKYLKDFTDETFAKNVCEQFPEPHGNLYQKVLRYEKGETLEDLQEPHIKEEFLEDGTKEVFVEIPQVDESGELLFNENGYIYDWYEFELAKGILAKRLVNLFEKSLSAEDLLIRSDMQNCQKALLTDIFDKGAEASGVQLIYENKDTSFTLKSLTESFREYKDAVLQLGTMEKSDENSSIDKCFIHFNEPFDLEKGGYLYLFDIVAPNKRTSYSSSRETQVVDRNYFLENVHVVAMQGQEENLVRLIFQDSSLAQSYNLTTVINKLRPLDESTAIQFIADSSLRFGQMWPNANAQIGYTFYKRKFVAEGVIDGIDTKRVTLADPSLIDGDTSIDLKDHISSGDAVKLIVLNPTSNFVEGESLSIELAAGVTAENDPYVGPYKIIWTETTTKAATGTSEVAAVQNIILSGPGNLVFVEIDLTNNKLSISLPYVFDNTYTYYAYALSTGEIVYRDQDLATNLIMFVDVYKELADDENGLQKAVAELQAAGSENIIISAGTLAPVLSKAVTQNLKQQHTEWYTFDQSGLESSLEEEADAATQPKTAEEAQEQEDNLIGSSGQEVSGEPTTLSDSIFLQNGTINFDNYDRIFFQSTLEGDTSDPLWLAPPDESEFFNAAERLGEIEYTDPDSQEHVHIGLEEATNEQLARFIRDSLTYLFDDSSAVAALEQGYFDSRYGENKNEDGVITALPTRDVTYTIEAKTHIEATIAALARTLFRQVNGVPIHLRSYPIYMPTFETIDVPVCQNEGGNSKWRTVTAITGSTTTTIENASIEDLRTLATVLLPINYTVRKTPTTTSWIKNNRNVVAWDQTTGTLTIMDKLGNLKARVGIPTVGFRSPIAYQSAVDMKLIKAYSMPNRIYLKDSSSVQGFDEYVEQANKRNYVAVTTRNKATNEYETHDYGIYEIFDKGGPIYLPTLYADYKDKTIDELEAMFATNTYKKEIAELIKFASNKEAYDAFREYCKIVDYTAPDTCEYISFKDNSHVCSFQMAKTAADAIIQYKQVAFDAISPSYIEHKPKYDSLRNTLIVAWTDWNNAVYAEDYTHKDFTHEDVDIYQPLKKKMEEAWDDLEEAKRVRDERKVEWDEAVTAKAKAYKRYDNWNRLYDREWNYRNLKSKLQDIERQIENLESQYEAYKDVDGSELYTDYIDYKALIDRYETCELAVYEYEVEHEYQDYQGREDYQDLILQRDNALRAIRTFENEELSDSTNWSLHSSYKERRLEKVEHTKRVATAKAWLEDYENWGVVQTKYHQAVKDEEAAHKAYDEAVENVNKKQEIYDEAKRKHDEEKIILDRKHATWQIKYADVYGFAAADEFKNQATLADYLPLIEQDKVIYTGANFACVDGTALYTDKDGLNVDFIGKEQIKNNAQAAYNAEREIFDIISPEERDPRWDQEVSDWNASSTEMNSSWRIRQQYDKAEEELTIAKNTAAALESLAIQFNDTMIPSVIKGLPYFTEDTYKAHKELAKMTSVSANSSTTYAFESLISESGIELTDSLVHIYGKINWPAISGTTSVLEKIKVALDARINASGHVAPNYKSSTDDHTLIAERFASEVEAELKHNFESFYGSDVEYPVGGKELPFKLTVNLATLGSKNVVVGVKPSATSEDPVSITTMKASGEAITCLGTVDGDPTLYKFDYGDPESEIIVSDDVATAGAAVRGKLLVYDAIKYAESVGDLEVSSDGISIRTEGTSIANAEVVYSTVNIVNKSDFTLRDDTMLLNPSDRVSVIMLIKDTQKDNFKFAYGDVARLNQLVSAASTLFEVPSYHFADFASYDNLDSLENFDKAAKGGKLKDTVFDLYPTPEVIDTDLKKNFYELDSAENVKFLENDAGRKLVRVLSVFGDYNGGQLVTTANIPEESRTIANENMEKIFENNPSKYFIKDAVSYGKTYNDVIQEFSPQYIPALTAQPNAAILTYPYAIKSIEIEPVEGKTNALIGEDYIVATVKVKNINDLTQLQPLYRENAEDKYAVANLAQAKNVLESQTDFESVDLNALANNSLTQDFFVAGTTTFKEGCGISDYKMSSESTSNDFKETIITGKVATTITNGTIYTTVAENWSGELSGDWKVLQRNLAISKLKLKVINSTNTLPRFVPITSFKSKTLNGNLMIETDNTELYIPENGYAQALLGKYKTPVNTIFSDGIFYEKSQKTINSDTNQFVLVGKNAQPIYEANGSIAKVPAMKFKSFAEADIELAKDLPTDTALDVASSLLIDLSLFDEVDSQNIRFETEKLLEVLNFIQSDEDATDDTLQAKREQTYELFRSAIKMSCKIAYSLWPADPLSKKVFKVDEDTLPYLGFTRSFKEKAVPVNYTYKTINGTYRTTNTGGARYLNTYSCDEYGNLLYLDYYGNVSTTATYNPPIPGIRDLDSIEVFSLQKGAVKSLVNSAFILAGYTIYSDFETATFFTNPGDRAIKTFTCIADPTNSHVSFSHIKKDNSIWPKAYSFKFVFRSLKLRLSYKETLKAYNFAYLKDKDGNTVGKIFFQHPVTVDNLLAFSMEQ